MGKITQFESEDEIEARTEAEAEALYVAFVDAINQADVSVAAVHDAVWLLVEEHVSHGAVDLHSLITAIFDGLARVGTIEARIAALRYAVDGVCEENAVGGARYRAMRGEE